MFIISLNTGLAALTAAQDALAEFQVDNADTAGALDTAQTNYETEVGSGNVVTDSAALTAALLSDAQALNAANLAAAEIVLSDAQIAIDGGTRNCNSSNW